MHKLPTVVSRFQQFIPTIPARETSEPVDNNSRLAWLPLLSREMRATPNVELLYNPNKKHDKTGANKTIHNVTYSVYTVVLRIFQYFKDQFISYLFEEEMVSQMVQYHWALIVYCVSF